VDHGPEVRQVVRPPDRGEVVEVELGGVAEEAGDVEELRAVEDGVRIAVGLDDLGDRRGNASGVGRRSP